MTKRPLLAVLILALVNPHIAAQEAAIEGLHVNIIVEEDTGGVLSEEQLRASAIVLLKTKLTEAVIDDDARLILYVNPGCFRNPDGYFCDLDVSLIRIGQDYTPFRGPVGNTSEMLYWSAGTILRGPSGNAPSHVREWLDGILDEPVAVWLSLDEEKRTCWRDYFNANETFAPLSPC